MIILCKRLDQKTADIFYVSMLEWFNDHPKRRVCRTDYGKIRRGHVIEDILPHCEIGVKINEN